MSRNKVLAIMMSVIACTVAYVMWQRTHPPEPVGAPLNGAASASPTSKPNLGKVGN
jgi:hypothetical protein